MHLTPIPQEIPVLKLDRWRDLLPIAGVLVALGVATVFFSASGDAARFWQAYLFNWLFWSSVAMGMVMLGVALHVTNASWAWPVRRMALAGAAFLPLSYLLLAPILLGGHEHLFHHWLHAEGDHVIEAKRGWLNLPGLRFRDFSVVATLYTLAVAFAWHHIRADRQAARGTREHAEAARSARRTLSWLGPVLGLSYAVIWAIVAIDLAMSLSPHWFSTMHPVSFFMGGFHTGIAATILFATFLRGRLGLQDSLRPAQYHDLGKLLFGFAVFWMYLNFSQYIVIWYGLLPVEQEWMVRRLDQPFRPLVGIAIGLIFGLTFFGLLTRTPKKQPAVLAFFASTVLLGHWLERYLLIAPSLYEGGPLPFGLPEIGIGLGFAGLFLGSILWYANRVPLIASPEVMMDHETVSAGAAHAASHA